MIETNSYTFIVDNNGRAIMGWGQTPPTLDWMTKGAKFFDEDNQKEYYWSGSAWTQIESNPDFNADHWDDLRFPAQGIAIGSLSVPPDRQADTGLLLFDGGGLIETVGVLAQLPHAWKTGSILRPHLHWAKTTDVANGVVWQMRYRWLQQNATPGAWSSQVTGTHVWAVGADQKHNMDTFGDIDGTGYGISDCLNIQFGRVSDAVGDTYTGDVVLYEFDIHYQIDSTGSAQEFTK